MVSHSDEETNVCRVKSWFPEEMLRAGTWEPPQGHTLVPQRPVGRPQAKFSTSRSCSSCVRKTCVSRGNEDTNHFCTKYCVALAFIIPPWEPPAGQACALLGCLGPPGPNCHRICRPRGQSLCGAWSVFWETLALICPHAGREQAGTGDSFTLWLVLPGQDFGLSRSQPLDISGKVWHAGSAPWT